MNELQEITTQDIRLLRAIDVADMLCICRSHAYLLMKRGEIPTVRFGRVVRVRLSDLEQYINMHLYNEFIPP